MEIRTEGISLRVAFDQQVFLLQEYGGISRYICSLASELSNYPELHTRIFAPLHFNRNLESVVPALHLGRSLPNLPTKAKRLVMMASKVMARREISKFRPDIIHETYYSEDDFQPNGTRRILTVYDLIHERYSDLFVNSAGTIRPKKIAANRADHVICISESTRRDVIEYCGVPEERTSVVYLGVDLGFIHSNASFPQQHHSRPFLLYVGARGGYKNFGRLIQAFAHSRFNQEFDLLCFGGGAFITAERDLILNSGLRPEQVIQKGGGDALLAALYLQATAFIYPSLYEGFGIPPLEAMARGCPVICSNTSSLPEVVGDAAETFDPLDEDSIQTAIENVLSSNDRRKTLVDAGRARHTLFTWEECARETEKIYRKVL